MSANRPERDAVGIYDTTLRDGTQREGISLTLEDKLRVVRRLDALGVSFIEAGWPGSNPKDAELFLRARELELKNAVLTAFGSTRRQGVSAAEDPQIRALVEAGTKAVTLFGKSSRLHVVDVLRTTLEENLRMIEDSVRHLAGSGIRVVYDAEHFFDGYEEDPSYALDTLRAAMRGGAEVIVLCDTNGGTFPYRIEEVVRHVATAIPKTIGIHAHDDTGCAVANSLAAVRAGARHVQGTINGYGERCGNANLCAIIPSLELKLGFSCLPEGGIKELHDVAYFVAEVANLPPDEHQPYVGRSAFAHKGGVHVAAMRRNAKSYQHVDPALVGNVSRVVVSELSGRGNVLQKSEELGVVAAEDVGARVLAEVKEAEARGFSYEAAEASVALLVRRATEGYEPPFRILDYQVIAGRRQGTAPYAEATVKVAVGKDVHLVAAEGNGPVAALDEALRKALVAAYPEVAKIHLVNYKVRILDGGDGTGAVTRVLVDSRDDERAWSTVGASANILEASLRALSDGIEHGLWICGAAAKKAAKAA